jgi:protein SCO1/2
LTAKQADKRFILLAALTAVISVAAGAGLWQLRREGPPDMTEALLILPEPRTVADFELVDQNGDDFSIERLRGQWSLLFFGFSYCPDVCPSALFDLQQVHEALNGQGQPQSPHQVVFVSVDPERDTPERLKDYTAYFHPDFVAVTGSNEQLAPLTMQLGVAYRIEPHEPGSLNYSVDHSASIMLIDPAGRLHGVFPAPHDPAKMVHDMKSVLQ